MKRFLAFTYDSYYPAGGKNDYIGDFDTPDEVFATKPHGSYVDILDTADGYWHEFTCKDRGGQRVWTKYNAEQLHAIREKA